MKRIKPLLFLLAVIGLIVLNSCLSSSVSSYSDDARVYSFSLKSDSVPAFAKATFTVNNTTDSIYNPDSLPFKTKMSRHFKAIPVISTYSTSAMFFNDTTYTSGDSIDFRWKHKFKNYAANGTTYKVYDVDVRVHKVEPDSIAWEKRSYPAYGSTETEQKVVYCNDLVMLFLNDGNNVSMYTTTDAKSWSGGSTISSLPSSTSIQNMVVLNNVIYLIGDGQTIYSSSDGTSWTKVPISSTLQLKSLICAYNNLLFAVAYDSNNNYYVVTSPDGQTWTEQYSVNSIQSGYSNNQQFKHFPITDFAVASFQPPTGTPKILIVGGKDQQGAVVNSVYSYMATADNWVDLSTEIPTDSFSVRKDAALIWYDDRNMMFGGTDENNSLVKDTILCSKTEGYLWTRNDTLVKFPKALDYKLRTRATITVDKYNRIFLIGGKTAETGGSFFREVWVGRKNKLGFGLPPM